MKRKEFYQLALPLTDKLYRFAWIFIPDDLQAEQLVIDSINAYLLKERKSILRKEVDLEDKKDTLLMRRQVFKGILSHMCTIGHRRSVQLIEQMRVGLPAEFESFYSLDSKIRFVIALRYDAQFTVEEIEDIVQMPRYEVIEKIHNGRFLLLNNLNDGISL
jgi:hypothetical protein